MLVGGPFDGRCGFGGLYIGRCTCCWGVGFSLRFSVPVPGACHNILPGMELSYHWEKQHLAFYHGILEPRVQKLFVYMLVAYSWDLRYPHT